jgi:hypothetical protein
MKKVKINTNLSRTLFICFLLAVSASIAAAACGGQTCDGYAVHVEYQGGIPPTCSDTLTTYVLGGCIDTTNPSDECINSDMWIPTKQITHYERIPPTQEQMLFCQAVYQACVWAGGTEEHCSQVQIDCMNSYVTCEVESVELADLKKGCTV